MGTLTCSFYGEVQKGKTVAISKGKTKKNNFNSNRFDQNKKKNWLDIDIETKHLKYKFMIIIIISEIKNLLRPNSV